MGDLDRAGAQFPLGVRLGPQDARQAVRPFGLRHRRQPTAVADLDWEQLGYDPDRQIAVVTDADGVVPAMKHTSTKTKTSTASDDRSPSDDDEDATGS